MTRLFSQRFAAPILLLPGPDCLVLLSHLKVDEGSQVKRGQVIGKIVDKKLKLTMASLDARLKAAKARRSKAQKDLKRGQKLKRKGVIAVAKVDALRAAFEIRLPMMKKPRLPNARCSLSRWNKVSYWPQPMAGC